MSEKKVLTKLYDKETKQYINKWLTEQQFENLPFRYCLPHEVKNKELEK